MSRILAVLGTRQTTCHVPDTEEQAPLPFPLHQRVDGGLAFAALTIDARFAQKTRTPCLSCPGVVQSDSSHRSAAGRRTTAHSTDVQQAACRPVVCHQHSVA